MPSQTLQARIQILYTHRKVMKKKEKKSPGITNVFFVFFPHFFGIIISSSDDI